MIYEIQQQLINLNNLDRITKLKIEPVLFTDNHYWSFTYTLNGRDYIFSDRPKIYVENERKRLLNAWKKELQNERKKSKKIKKKSS